MPPPYEWDVYKLLPGSNPPEYVATLYDAREKSIRPDLLGPGSGSFTISKTSTNATTAVLGDGEDDIRLVKVRIPEIDDGYIFAFFIETGDFTLLSSDEEGGELLRFSGRGALVYLDHGVAWSESYITGGDDPFDGLWRAYNAGTGDKPGQVLRRLIEEFQDADRPQAPIPLLTPDFDYTNDSDATAWATSAATDEFTYQVGEGGYAITQRLMDTGAIYVVMDPDFTLHAYNAYGRDLTGDAFGSGVVRFVKGVNIATELRRERRPRENVTHLLAGGEKDAFGTATASNAASRVTREGYVDAYGTGITALNGIAAAELAKRADDAETAILTIVNRRTDVVLSEPVSVGSVKSEPGLATAGFYLPGPQGTNGDFWLGDIVRVHTGTSGFDYNEVDFRVRAITIARDDDNGELIVIPELDQPASAVATPKTVFAILAHRDQVTGYLTPDGWTVEAECDAATDGITILTGPLDEQFLSIATSPSSNYVQLAGVQFRGLGSSGFVPATESDPSFDLTASISITTTGAGIILAGIRISNFDSGARTLTDPDGWVVIYRRMNQEQASDRDWGVVSYGYVPVATADTYTLTWTMSNQFNWHKDMVAVFIPYESDASAFEMVQVAPGVLMPPEFGVTFPNPL